MVTRPTARICIEITEIYLVYPRFPYNYVFIILLNYMQYKGGIPLQVFRQVARNIII